MQPRATGCGNDIVIRTTSAITPSWQNDSTAGDRVSDYRALPASHAQSYILKAAPRILSRRWWRYEQEEFCIMSESGDRPASLVFYTLAVAGAVIGGWAMFSHAGHAYVNWLVTEKLPEITAQTQAQFDFDSPFGSGVDSTWTQTDYDSSGAFSE
jgi:hypothetical protein